MYNPNPPVLLLHAAYRLHQGGEKFQVLSYNGTGLVTKYVYRQCHCIRAEIACMLPTVGNVAGSKG